MPHQLRRDIEQLEYLVSKKVPSEGHLGLRVRLGIWGWAEYIEGLVVIAVAVYPVCCEVLSPDRQRFVQDHALPEFRRVLLHVLVAAGGMDAFVVTPPQPQLLVLVGGDGSDGRTGRRETRSCCAVSSRATVSKVTITT